jgi:hypothetical protein
MAINTEKVTLYGENDVPYDVNVIIDDSNGGLAIDYTQIFNKLNLNLSRIADSLETSDSTNLADIISSNGSRVADALETTDSSANLADNISILRNLGETSGIRTVSPYEYVTLISIYKLLIEENKLFDTTRAITQTEKDQIKQRISEYIDGIDDYFPPKFTGDNE